MKFLPTLLICQVLSLSVASQAQALQKSLPVNEINQILQIKIENDVHRSLGADRYFRELNPKLGQEKNVVPYADEQETFIAPDCLCELQTRVM